MQNEKADITVVSEKGQVVIPQTIRKKLGIGPKPNCSFTVTKTP